MERTIAAVATPVGTGGVSIIRISGSEAVQIAASVFSVPKRILQAATHTINYGYITDGGERIDEVLVSVMRAPRSYTGEDVVEINSHGGVVVTNKILETVIKAGAYPAEPGEFTKRAFINGKMDLTRAEAVIDLINAKNELGRKNAFAQLSGSLADKITKVRGELVSLAARMQVAIDYPDEDLEDVDTDEILKILKLCEEEIIHLIHLSKNGKIVSDGITTAIVGKPNVGKSSFLNLLAGYERAIVTDVAGTTRDVITENVTFDSIPLALYDTAGIRDTEDIVEKIGVDRSEKTIENCELVLFMLDADSGVTDDELRLLDSIRQKKHIIIINKTDISDTDFSDIILDSPAVYMSVKNEEGLQELSGVLHSMFDLGELTAGDNTVITNMRHKTALFNAKKSIDKAISSIQSGMPQDLITIDMNDAMDSLGEITGATVSEDVVSEIFHRFCVGK